MDILILDLKKEFWLFNLFSLFVGLILIILTGQLVLNLQTILEL